MRPVTFRPVVRIIAALCGPLVICGALVPPLRSAHAATSDGRNHAAVRLIAASARVTSSGRVLRAGVEIRLDRGWKTYWRYPGDSGVPPRFSFARSENLENAVVLWPAPRRFSDEAGTSIGYSDEVIFPLRITPQDPARPVLLRLDLEFAVCEKLCVPEQASAELAIDGAATSFDTLIATSEARVPKTGALGDSRPLAIRAVRREAVGSSQVIVDVAAPDPAAVTLFVEGPSPDWALPVPEAVAGAPPGIRRFAFPLDGVPAGASPDHAVLTLTAVTPDAAIEVATRLD